MHTKSKELDFELNLLPILSVLSVCICFLLTTAVWTRMGFIGINQAIGDQLPAEGSGVPADNIFIKAKASGEILLQWRSGADSSTRGEKVIPALQSGKFNWERTKNDLLKFVKSAQTKTVIVMPEIGVNYGETIRLLDQLKGQSLKIGLAPAIKGVH